MAEVVQMPGDSYTVMLCLEIVSASRNKVTKESLFQESFRHLLSTSLSGRLDTVKHGELQLGNLLIVVRDDELTHNSVLAE